MATKLMGGGVEGLVEGLIEDPPEPPPGQHPLHAKGVIGRWIAPARYTLIRYTRTAVSWNKEARSDAE